MFLAVAYKNKGDMLLVPCEKLRCIFIVLDAQDFNAFIDVVRKRPTTKLSCHTQALHFILFKMDSLSNALFQHPTCMSLNLNTCYYEQQQKKKHSGAKVSNSHIPCGPWWPCCKGHSIAHDLNLAIIFTCPCLNRSHLCHRCWLNV